MSIATGQMTQNPKRQSIAPTYDSRETGPRYWVTTEINDRTLTWRKPIDDPFVRQTVVIGWRDLLRSLLRLQAKVVVSVGADIDLVNDVMELDANCLVPNSTRRDDFNSDIGRKVAAHGAEFGVD